MLPVYITINKNALAIQQPIQSPKPYLEINLLQAVIKISLLLHVTLSEVELSRVLDFKAFSKSALKRFFLNWSSSSFLFLTFPLRFRMFWMLLVSSCVTQNSTPS